MAGRQVYSGIQIYRSRPDLACLCRKLQASERQRGLALLGIVSLHVQLPLVGSSRHHTGQVLLDVPVCTALEIGDRLEPALSRL